MGAGLTGDGQALGLGGADEGDGFLGGDVAHVVAAAGLPHQGDITLHLAPLAFGGVAGEAVGGGIDAVVDAPAFRQQRFILTVGHDGLVQRLGKSHGAAHHVRGLDAFPSSEKPATSGAMASMSASSAPDSPRVMAP